MEKNLQKEKKLTNLRVWFPFVIPHYPFFEYFSIGLDLIFLPDNFPGSNHPGMTVKFDGVLKAFKHGLYSRRFESLQVRAWFFNWFVSHRGFCSFNRFCSDRIHGFYGFPRLLYGVVQRIREKIIDKYTSLDESKTQSDANTAVIISDRLRHD